LSRAASSHSVAVAQAGRAEYPKDPPFDPPERYPELAAATGRLDASNHVYPAVRDALRLLDLDSSRFGTPAWDPLGGVVRPGDRVVIKPNLVRHFHGDSAGLEALVTHASVVRTVLDYVIVALQGSGSIIVGDSPLQYSDFRATLEASGLSRVLEAARPRAGVPIETVDFRRTRSEKRDGMIVARLPNDGDPRGYQVVDLKSRSSFAGLPARRLRRFRVTQYDPRTMRQAHNEAAHAYLFPASVLAADVLINIPKLKTHRKAGLTAAMKNLVGINGSKDWLPHHTFGARDDGGDEYPRRSLRKSAISMLRDGMEASRGHLSRRALRLMERTVKATGHLVRFPDPCWEGSWHGNDTIWRMVHDLHRVLFLADASGAVHDLPQRRYLAVVDAVIAGEGEGPMRPVPRASGLVVAGLNPIAVDTVCCRLMGFDENKVPLLRNAYGGGVPPGLAGAGDIEVVSSAGRWNDLLERPRDRTLKFSPPASWAGAIELDR